MAKKLIRLTEQDLHNIIKESVSKILSETWKLTDYGISQYDEYGYPDPLMPSREKFPDRWFMYDRPLPNFAAATKYNIPTNQFAADSHPVEHGKPMRPSNWFTEYGKDNSPSSLSRERHNVDADIKSMHDKEKRFNKDNLKRALDAADKRPLHRNGSLNRAFD